MALPTPTTLDGFTNEWLTQALRASGALDTDTSVTGSQQQILGEGEGFMGVLARLTLTYEGGTGPGSVIVKIPTSVELNRATGRALGIYEREVRTYADLLPGIDIPTPGVFTAVYEANGTESEQLALMEKAERLPMFLLRPLIRRQQDDANVPPCVLMIEDLGHAEMGDQVAGATPERVAAGLTAMAKLHAATWGAEMLPATHWCRTADDFPRVFHALYLNGRRAMLKQAGPLLSDHSRALVKSARKTGVERIRRMHDTVPSCLLHGDFRLDNLFFAPDGSVAAVIDWQSATPGQAVLDIAYFVISSLPADTPETTIDELLAHYHAELVAAGVDDYPLDRLLSDYLDGMLLLLHRMPALTDNLEFGEGRGVDLIEVWLQRLDARLHRIPA